MDEFSTEKPLRFPKMFGVPRFNSFSENCKLAPNIKIADEQDRTISFLKGTVELTQLLFQLEAGPVGPLRNAPCMVCSSKGKKLPKTDH